MGASDESSDADPDGTGALPPEMVVAGPVIAGDWSAKCVSSEIEKSPSDRLRPSRFLESMAKAPGRDDDDV